MMALAKVKTVAVVAVGLVAGGLMAGALGAGTAEQVARNTADASSGQMGKPRAADAVKQTGEGLDCMGRMRSVTVAIVEYSYTHDMHLPPSLGATLPFLRELRAEPGETEGQWMALTPREKAQRYLCPSEAKGVELPAEVTEEWVNQHTSFVYLGHADIVVSKVGADPGKVVILYERLASGHPDIKGRFPLFFLDGHGEALDRAEADRLIAESKRILEAARTPATSPVQ